MSEKRNYVLGIDVGISSVGWGLLELNINDEPYKIINAGSRIFTPGEVAKTGASKALERRQKRGLRRIIRRRELRLDRVRYLLYKNGFLDANFKYSEPDKQANELTKIFDDQLLNYYKNKKVSPYDLKVDALSRKLSAIELGIILVHYAKHRGYKSNREDNSSDKNVENGKIKESIKLNKDIMEKNKYLTISQMFIQDKKFKDKIRNSSDDYKMSVTREMYFDEISKVLDSQISFGVIDSDFKNEYIDIWKSQRDYSKGPGGNSPYGGDLIERMTGKCSFDNELRAAKCNPSSELFVAISKLVNLRYKNYRDNNYLALTEDQIKHIIFLGMNQDKITYENVAKYLNVEKVVFKQLDLTTQQYIKCIKKFKTDVLKLDKENIEKLDFSILSDEQRNKFDAIKSKELLSKTCFELKMYSVFRKEFVKKDKELWQREKYNLDMLDDIATILTNCKLDQDIITKVNESKNIDNSLADFIVSLPNCKDHMMLSRNIIVKLIEIMINGVNYNDAMEQLGYSFNNMISSKEKYDLLPSFNSDNQIRNQRVLHSLSQTRMVINAIIKKYGLPKYINVETARELAKTSQERKEIEKQQKEKFEKNLKTKQFLIEEFPSIFKSIDNISTTDLLKYNLWKEQDEKCGYTMQHISISQLFDKNSVQIDHILPYSRTFNDNYYNKSLVFTKANQDKKDRTPYEWFGNTDKWTLYKNFINSLQIPEKKKENYLLNCLNKEIESEMQNQNLNDTKYISTFLISYIKSYLNVEGVHAYAGAITGKLRSMWGLNGLTHSLESSNYRISKSESDTFEKIKKNRNNHLHHALDALVIASINPKLEMQMSRYEKYKRYLHNNTKEGINYLLQNNIIIKDNDDNKFDNISGELIKKEDLKKYVNELIENDYLIQNKQGKYKFYFPQPYKGFSDETMTFVYEQDRCKKQSFFKNTRKYSTKEIDEMHQITPSFAKPKISGKLHGETLYGALNTKYYNVENNQFITSRVNINSESFSAETIEKMIDIKGGSKDICNTLKLWIDGYKNGADAFKNHGYPIVNKETGKTIKKVTIKKAYDGKGHFVNGAIVDKETVYKIGFYKSKDTNDQKIYAVGYDVFDLNMIKNNKDFAITLWYGQCESNITINYSELRNNFNVYLLASKNQLVSIENAKNISTVTYLNAFSNGKLEVKSAIGDGKDLYGKDRMFNKEDKNGRYQITISRIKSIKPLNITILGEVSGV